MRRCFFPSSKRRQINTFDASEGYHGLTLFDCYTSIPAEAIAHLMNLTDCRHIVAHSSLQALATDSADSMCRLGLGSPQVIQLSSFEIYGEADQTNEKTWDMMIATNDLAALPAFIVHSSGSTGLPKPIAVTHKGKLGTMACICRQH